MLPIDCDARTIDKRKSAGRLIRSYEPTGHMKWTTTKKRNKDKRGKI